MSETDQKGPPPVSIQSKEQIVTETNHAATEQSQQSGEDPKPSSKYFRFNPMGICAWYNGLVAIDKFNFFIMLFTGVLSVVGLLQYSAYVEAERAFLILDEIKLVHNEPSIEDGGLNFIIRVKNVGKHPGLVTKLIVVVSTGYGTFPITPDYDRDLRGTFIVGPIASQGWATVPVEERQDEKYDIPREEFIGAIRDGTLEFRIYGVIQYNTGYYWLDGVTGYCLLFTPANKRVNRTQSFSSCQNENYVYAK
ncbi:MAG: hypothetical protein AB7L09_14370 [Nitrospira sp.]